MQRLIGSSLGALAVLFVACASLTEAKEITSFRDIAGWWVEAGQGRGVWEVVIDDNGAMILMHSMGPTPHRSALRLTGGKAISQEPDEQLVIVLNEDAGRRVLRFVWSKGGKEVNTVEFVPQAVSTSPQHPPAVEINTEVVLVPAGEFTMGSDDGRDSGRPARRVYLDAFYIDKYEVTMGMYNLSLWDSGRASPVLPGSMKWSDFDGFMQPVVGVT